MAKTKIDKEVIKEHMEVDELEVYIEKIIKSARSHKFLCPLPYSYCNLHLNRILRYGKFCRLARPRRIKAHGLTRRSITRRKRLTI